MRIDHFCKLTGGRILRTGPEEFSGFTTDTRKGVKGGLFLALVGDRFDAHDFLIEATVQQPAAIVIHDAKHLPPTQGIAVIVVEDTLAALQDYARGIRLSSPSQYIGITGSNGKTSTKNFLKTLLGESAFSNKGSFNNHWGVPFTLIEAGTESESVVVEMGMNHPGEIKKLVDIARPDIVGVTNVGRAHLEFFDGMESLSEAKAEIYRYAPDGARAVFNLDCRWTREHRQRYESKFAESYSFSTLDPAADVFIQVEQADTNGLKLSGEIGRGENRVRRDQIRVPILGRHNASNLAAAAAFALAAGRDVEEIWKRIPLCQGEWGRNMLIDRPHGGRLLFDGYNANPESFRALCETLKELKVPSLYGVFGSMAELGDGAGEAHESIGNLLSQLPFQKTLFIGPHGQEFAKGFPGTQILESANRAAIDKFVADIPDNGLIVIKGSRSIELESLFDGIPPKSF